MKGWLMRLFGTGRQREDVEIDPASVREELTRTDPAYARVRQALHDARNLQNFARENEKLRALTVARARYDLQQRENPT